MIKSFVKQIFPDVRFSDVDSFDLIVIGVFLYTLTNALLLYYLPQYIWWVLDLISVALFVFGLLKSRRKSVVDADFVFCSICMIVYALLILLIGIVNLDINVPHLITQSTYFLPFLLPFIVLIGINRIIIGKLYKYLYLGCFIALIFLMSKSYDFIFNTQEVFGKMHEDADNAIWGGLYFWLSMVVAGCPFYMAISIFYMSRSVPNRCNNFIIVLTIILSVIFALSFGRRMSAVSGLLFLVSPFIVNMLYVKHKLKYLLLFLIVGAACYSFYIEFAGLFPILQERLEDNTRGGLLDDLVYDFDALDWLFGRGLNATYRSPSGLGDESIRTLVESGYLDIILHAGILYLLFFSYMLLRATYLGLFKGKNIYVKSAGVYLLLHMIMMITQDRLSFSLDFLMVYIAISMCGSRKWRCMKLDNVKLKVLSNE